MSGTAAAVRAPARRPSARPASRPPAPPRLRAVAPVHTRSRAGLALLCVLMLAGGLVGLLLLNISLTAGSYELADAQVTQRNLADRRQALQEQVEALQAPQTLAARATGLGMVPAPNTAFVRLPDGTVLGDPSRASSAPPPPAPAAAQVKAAAGAVQAAAAAARSAKHAGTTAATPAGKTAGRVAGARKPVRPAPTPTP